MMTMIRMLKVYLCDTVLHYDTTMRIYPLLCFLLLLPAVAPAQTVGEAAPDFSAVTLDGEDQRLSDLHGSVVLLDFWASWCLPCRKELPFLAEFYNSQHLRGFEVLAINVDAETEMMEAFIEALDFELPFPVIADAEGALPALYEIPGMPTVIFIDRGGMIRYVHSGFRSSHKDKYRSELLLLLEESE